MVSDHKYIDWLIRVLFFIGGSASTVIGSWVSSKIHVYHDNRKAHLDDIKQRVLAPLRESLLQAFASLRSYRVPELRVEWAEKETNESTKVTDIPTQSGPVLVAPHPCRAFTHIDMALYQDAKRNHFRKLIAKLEGVISAYAALAGECHAWVNNIANEVSGTTDLPRFPAQNPGGYVMHLRLAYLVYQRLFGMPSGVLRKQCQGERWTVESDGALAEGSAEQLDELLAVLDIIHEAQKAKASEFRDRAAKINDALLDVENELAFMNASRRIRRTCDLVPFF